MNSIIFATRTVLSKYSTFSGRATRSELWWWMLSAFIILTITWLIDGALILPLLGFDRFQPEGGQPLSVIVSLAFILPNIAVGVRRLHDIGRTWRLLLIGLIPVLGILVLLYFYVQPSEETKNKYGPFSPFAPT